MQTQLAPSLKDSPLGREAESIVQKCVHCGFCLATCPTYTLVGDELDSPRGRIYLMKQMLEGAPVTEKTRHHLDRCLTCRACETTCPSGVQYGRLVDAGRVIAEEKAPRTWAARAMRWGMRQVLARPSLFGLATMSGRLAKPFLPATLAKKLPGKRMAGPWPASAHARTMIVLQGCVQPVLAPDINAAFARVMDALGVSVRVAASAGCCGALDHHLNAHDASRQRARDNIDAWWSLVEAGAEAIVITASGCGTQVRDYAHLLQDDALYASRAAKVAALARDPAEVLQAERDRLTERLSAAPASGLPRVAFHSPCSLQHGLKIRGVVEALLKLAGYSLTSVPDSHLCCGSAGTYSLLQAELSQSLLERKVAALQSDAPALIATANIGCLTHIESGADRPVRHWIELIDARIATMREPSRI
ncbi:MAG: glycolate oxidase subunit GlcF [Betaproteobacteria bacterium]|nr:glycolate oxidase subunit GlcF [Betaproteobacteria bacterium]